MVRQDGGQERFYIEGILSFLKSCERFRLESTERAEPDREQIRFIFDSFAESPIAYTKISCFLPWVAQQYGYYFPLPDDDACVSGQGKKPPFNSTHDYDSTCRETVGSDFYGDERECIFPFYWGEKLYDTCALYSPAGLAIPLWVCPTRNTTKKYPGTNINHFPDEYLQEAYFIDTEHLFNTCVAKEGETCDPNNYSGCDPSTREERLDPEITDHEDACKEDCPNNNNKNCCPNPFFHEEPGTSAWPVKWIPFSTCKTDCPGVKGFGIIGGGAVLFSASAFAGTSILPIVGAAVTTIGGGALATRAMCSAPFCRAQSGQCCLLFLRRRSPVCPRSC